MSALSSFVVSAAAPFRPLGVKRLSNGVELIGPTPWVAPDAWLHCVFPAALPDDVMSLEAEIGGAIPADYVGFLLDMNGVTLFSDALRLYGRRKALVRTGDDAWQPYDLSTPNVQERLADAGDNLCIGSYKYDGTRVYINRYSQRISRTERFRYVVLNTWPSLEAMLSSELKRLAGLFDEMGKRLNKKLPTVPPASV